MLTLTIPILLLASFLLFRRTCPTTYTATDKYCPFRTTGRQLAKIPPVAAYLQRRERNRGIRARQHDYMSRRAKFGFGGGRSRVGGEAEMGTGVGAGAGGEKRNRQRKDEARRDEWLRSDMLAHYGREKGGVGCVSMSMKADRGGVGPTSEKNENENQSDSLWPTSPSATLVNESSRTNLGDMSTPAPMARARADGYVLGRLTGDYVFEYGDGDGHGQGATHPREMTLKEKIRAQREKILQEEAEGAGSVDGGSGGGSDGVERSLGLRGGGGLGLGLGLGVDVDVIVATGTAQAKEGNGGGGGGGAKGEGIREGWVL